MKCPRDNTDLQPHHFNQIPFHRCLECGGLWVEKDGLESLKKYQFDNIGALPVSESSPCRGPHGKAICPLDSAAMTMLEFNGVFIDCCSTCGGTWLDGGELEVICHNYRQGEGLKGELSANAIFELVVHSIPFF